MRSGLAPDSRSSRRNGDDDGTVPGPEATEFRLQIREYHRRFGIAPDASWGIDRAPPPPMKLVIEGE